MARRRVGGPLFVQQLTRSKVQGIWRVVDIVLFTLAPLNRLEYFVAQLVTVSPLLIWIVVLRGHAFVGFPRAVTFLFAVAIMAYSLAFGIRRLLDVGVDTKAKAFLCILGYNAISNLLTMGVGKSILPFIYGVYYMGMLLLPSATPRPMWTQDLRC
jgi:hypothetical protein